MAAGMLDRIVAVTRARVEQRKQARPNKVVLREAAARNPRDDLFLAAIQRRDRVNVIAECKRRSPVKGLLRETYDAVALATAYQAAGAAAISVLTEESFFDGALDHLSAVRRVVGVPVMRKDFIVDEYQIGEARAAGADALLLIAAVLGDDLARFVRRAHEAGVAALVEVHDRDELRRATDAGARIVGVNNRDLGTMTVRLQTAIELAPEIPCELAAVAESGIRTASDVAALRACGYSAFLVGEQLVRSVDPRQALTELLDAPAAQLEPESDLQRPSASQGPGPSSRLPGPQGLRPKVNKDQKTCT